MILLIEKNIYRTVLQLKKSALLIMVLLCAMAATAQNFNLQVTATAETCLGNGTLTFSVPGAADTPAVNFKIYKLPGTTTIYDGAAGTLSGQQAGNYKVIATQTINGTTQTDEVTIEIPNQLTPLVFTAVAHNAICGNDGSIVVNVSSGTAVSYEITSGPVTVPPQSSETFINLPAGFYMVKATDACGNAPVVSLSLFSLAPQLEVKEGQFPDAALPGCNLITARNIVSPLSLTGIVYPLTVSYTVYPPGGGAPQYFSQTIPDGLSNVCAIDQVIPFYYDTPYYYDIVVTDPCGVQHSALNNLVNEKLRGAITFGVAECSKQLFLTVEKFGPPYTITFTQSPAGFDPEALNSLYPGPYSDPLVIFGDVNNDIPVGIYKITITDDCGRTTTAEAELEPDPDPVMMSQSSNSDCTNNLGKIEIYGPPRVIASIIMTDKPDEYIATLPLDVTQYVTVDDGFIMTGLPPGSYTFDVVDNCGHLYDPIIVVVPEYAGTTLSALSRPDCTPGLGTIYLGAFLNSVIVTTAPAGYPNTLPHDISNLINANGDLYLEGVMPGNYTFTLTSPCAGPLPKALQVAGNTVSQNDYVYTPHCGSFDLDIRHTATPSASVKFWLQKEYGPNSGIWGHPNGNTEYTGSLPEATNSFELYNNTTNYSLMYSTGNYRILKSYRSFSATEPGGVKICVDQIYDFSYYDTLQILGAENLSCSGSTSDVKVNVMGVEPITYTITHKNGIPFNVTNGTNNIFAGLDPATYTIKAEDPCGHEETFSFNVADLPAPVYASSAPDLTDCDPDGDGMQTFDLSVQDTYVIAGLDYSVINLTYHASLNDAQLDINPLPMSYTTASTTVYARVEHTSNPLTCYAVNHFSLIVFDDFELNMPDKLRGCEGEPNAITADAGYTSYLWSTGETTQTIYPEHAGTYEVTATDSNLCTATKSILLTTTGPAVIAQVDITDWTDHDNTITVLLNPYTGSEENVEYSIDNVTWQSGNTFTGLESGKYKVYARDKFGCGGDGPVVSYLLTYPRYFTPNGDNVNETWRIKFSTLAEPNLMVYIYDRFGKLITGFDANSEGWDGTLNGSFLPSTDYWFTVRRQDGKEYRGHFAMIR